MRLGDANSKRMVNDLGTGGAGVEGWEQIAQRRWCLGRKTEIIGL